MVDVVDEVPQVDEVHHDEVHHDEVPISPEVHRPESPVAGPSGFQVAKKKKKRF